MKREIVAATLEAGASVAGVARRYGVNANQVFAWRKHFGVTGEARTATEHGGSAEVGMVPLVLTMEAPATTESLRDDRIEIELASGYRVRIGANVEVTALRRVLDVLERR